MAALEQLPELRCRHRICTHINDTKPVLWSSPSSAQRWLERLDVAFDGLRISL